jgi:AraC-like DNA-binding protein
LTDGAGERRAGIRRPIRYHHGMRSAGYSNEDPLTTLLAACSGGRERTDALHPGVVFHSAVRRGPISKKTHLLGPVLVLVAQGRIKGRFGGLELHNDPSQYMVVSGAPSLVSEILEASPARPYLSVCLALPVDLIAKTLLALADAQAAPLAAPVPAYLAPADPSLKDAVVRFLGAIDEPLERRLLAPLILEEMVFRLLRSNAAAVLRNAVVRDPDSDSILKAMRFMRAHSSQPLSVEEVARQVAMSPSHFAHRFRAVARTSPMRYLKQLRLEQARALMLSDGLRVSEAAARVGYESPSHFTRDFKTYFGATPARYLDDLRQIAESGETSAALGIVVEDSLP